MAGRQPAGWQIMPLLPEALGRRCRRGSSYIQGLAGRQLSRRPEHCIHFSKRRRQLPRYRHQLVASWAAQQAVRPGSA